MSTTQGPVPFPLDHSAPDGCYSFCTSWNANNGALSFVEVDYGTINYQLLGQPPTQPVPFGTVGDTAVIGYEFLYCPNIVNSIQSSIFADGVHQQLEDSFLNYKWFRVSRMTVVLERLGTTPLKVLVVEGGQLPANNASSAGPQAIFQVCRFGNSYHSVRPSDRALNWNSAEACQMHAFHQMENVLPRNRKSMRYVKDMSRARRLRFSFAPTTQYFDVSAMPAENSIYGAVPNEVPITYPYQDTDIRRRYPKFRRHPWTRTSWVNTSGAGQETSTVLGPLFGLCGALKPGSWRPGDWSQWTMKTTLTVQFRGRQQPGDQASSQVVPISYSFGRYFPNYSYVAKPT